MKRLADQRKLIFMQEPVVWVQPETPITERVREPAARPARSWAVSFGVIAAVAWIVPIHTVAALVVGLALSAAALIAGTQG